MRKPIRCKNWYETFSVSQMAAVFDSLRFVSVGDDLVTDCGVVHGDSLVSRVQIKSTMIPAENEKDSRKQDRKRISTRAFCSL